MERVIVPDVERDDEGLLDSDGSPEADRELVSSKDRLALVDDSDGENVNSSLTDLEEFCVMESLERDSDGLRVREGSSDKDLMERVTEDVFESV